MKDIKKKIEKLLEKERIAAENEQSGTSQNAFIVGKIKAYEKVLELFAKQSYEKTL